MTSSVEAIESQMSDRKVELADLETVSYYIDDLQNLLKEGTLAEGRTFIRSFVKEAKVKDEHLKRMRQPDSYSTPC